MSAKRATTSPAVSAKTVAEEATETYCSAGWQWESLADIAAEGAPILYGILQPGPDTPGGVPYVRPTEIVEDVIDLPSVRRTTPAIAGKYKRSLLKPDDVILSIVGTIGKVAIVPPDLDGGNITQSSVRFRPRAEKVSSRYVAWALRSPTLRSQFDKHRLGTAVPRLNVAHVRALQVPVPPLLEQDRIVAEIEKQFTRLDAGVAALRRVQANLKRYRAAVLKAACEGRLVPTEAELARKEGRTFETGEALLARILKERRENWRDDGRYKDPVAPELDGLPSLPGGWCYTSAEQVCSAVASGSTPAAPKMFSGAGEVPFLKVYNLTHTGRLDFSVKPTFIERRTHEGLLARSRVFPHDVLMNIVGPPLGKISLVPDTFPEWNINQAIVVFRPTAALRNPLLAYWLQSDHVLGRLERTAKATAGQFNLQVTACRKLALPIPPRAEQTRIVAEVERRFSVIEELQAVVAANLQRATRFRQSVLRAAFSGERAQPPIGIVQASRSVLR